MVFSGMACPGLVRSMSGGDVFQTAGPIHSERDILWDSTDEQAMESMRISTSNMVIYGDNV
jgi:hypothetical protein